MERMTAVLSVAALLSAAASVGRADSEYDNTVRAGVYYLHYALSADDISGPYVPPGLNIDVPDVVTLYLAYVRKLSSHWDFEFALGYPPLTKTEGKGPATVGSVPYNGQVISTARWVAPTVLFNYEFRDPSASLRPYVGVGINYTHFIDKQSTAQGDAVSGGPTSISLPDSVGPAATVGLVYRLTPRWSFYASYSASMVNARLTANTAGVIRTTHIEFWPLALVVSAGFSF